jgi:hypothetical protein
MSRRIHPIKDLPLPSGGGFPLALEDAAERIGVKQDDEFTYTTRYTAHTQAQRDALRDAAQALVDAGEMDADEFTAFVTLMEEHDWDVSFLVDCY